MALTWEIQPRIKDDKLRVSTKVWLERVRVGAGQDPTHHWFL